MTDEEATELLAYVEARAVTDAQVEAWHAELTAYLEALERLHAERTAYLRRLLDESGRTHASLQ